MYIFYQNLIRDIPWSERNNSHTIEYSFYVISHQMIPLRFMTFFYRLTQQRVVIVPSILHQMKALLVHPRTLSCIVYNRRMIYRFFQLLPVRRFVEVIPMKKDIQNSITQVKNYFSFFSHMIDGILIGKMYLGFIFPSPINNRLTNIVFSPIFKIYHKHACTNILFLCPI